MSEFDAFYISQSITGLLENYKLLQIRDLQPLNHPAVDRYWRSNPSRSFDPPPENENKTYCGLCFGKCGSTKTVPFRSRGPRRRLLALAR